MNSAVRIVGSCGNSASTAISYMSVENIDVSELRTAAWLFLLYLILINLFVMPIGLPSLHFCAA